MGSRLCSSDSPSENISRYPVPSKKDLPIDIAERMEEVESKVHTKQWRYRAMLCCTVPLPYSECAKTRRFLTGRLFTECLQSPLPQTGRVQSLLLLLWWTYEQRDRCVFVYQQRSCHYVFMLKFVKVFFFYGQALGHKCLISQSFNWIKPIIYMHQSSTKLSFLRHTWRNSTGICSTTRLLSASCLMQPFISGWYPENEPFWTLRYPFLTFFNAGIFCWGILSFAKSGNNRLLWVHWFSRTCSSVLSDLSMRAW